MSKISNSGSYGQKTVGASRGSDYTCIDQLLKMINLLTWSGCESCTVIVAIPIATCFNGAFLEIYYKVKNIKTKIVPVPKTQKIKEYFRIMLLSLQTCSYWYSYNDTMELMAESGEQIYHFEQLINAGGLWSSTGSGCFLAITLWILYFWHFWRKQEG